MKNWIIANPRKLKKNWRRFIVNWLNKAAQDKNNKLMDTSEHKTPSMSIAKVNTCPICKQKILGWETTCSKFECSEAYAKKLRTREK